MLGSAQVPAVGQVGSAGPQVRGAAPAQRVVAAVEPGALHGAARRQVPGLLRPRGACVHACVRRLVWVVRRLQLFSPVCAVAAEPACVGCRCQAFASSRLRLQTHFMCCVVLSASAQFAVNCLRRMRDDELKLWLLQLVQCLKVNQKLP